MITFRENKMFSNIIYGVISSIFSICITSGITFLYEYFKTQELPLGILVLLFVFISSTILLIIKMYLIYKKTKIINYEVKDLYPNFESLSNVLKEILPTAKQVNILDLRGFLYTQQDSLLFKEIFNNDNALFHILLSDPSSSNTYYRANHTPNKSPKVMMNEIQSSIDSIIELNKKNIQLKLYKEHNVFRLIFIDDELFATPFRDGSFISNAPTMKFSKDSAFYKCYKDYFQELWDNQSFMVTHQVNTNQNTSE